jgi:hypothetical protein
VKRAILAVLATALAVAAVAPVGLGAPATADISVAFSADSFSATLTSSKGVSHYEVVLCDKTTAFKVELSGKDNVVTIGPYESQIVSVAVKSATTKTVFFSNYAGECGKKPDPDPDPK